jgi:hypothetical protein
VEANQGVEFLGKGIVFAVCLIVCLLVGLFGLVWFGLFV